jgi:hypothetical protein
VGRGLTASAEVYTPQPDVAGLTPSSGPNAGGTRVVISGESFDATSTVSFGGVPAQEVTFDSPTQLTVTAPPRAQGGGVEVTVSGGRGTSASGAPAQAGFYTYNGCDPPAGTGGLAYPAGYSLVGLPGGTMVPADSLLYGWQNSGGGAKYSVQDPSAGGVAGGQGYWAWFSCTRSVSPAAGSSQTTAPLAAGHASMVGNPSASSPATVSGHDFAAMWDQSLNGGAGGYHISGYRQAQSVQVGQGTWVFAYQATTVDIRAAAQ